MAESSTHAVSVLTGDELVSFLSTEAAKDCQDNPAITQRVSSLIDRVKMTGDKALREIAVELGDNLPAAFKLTSEAAQSACESLSVETKAVLNKAAANILEFAQASRSSIKDFKLQQSGFEVSMRYEPVASVACYVPGGRYPLPSTALMTSITARESGVEHVYLLSPQLCPETIYAGTLAGVDAFFEVGGAHGVAAFAYGTQTIPKVDMLVGPGNAYVTEAKRQLQGIMGIDLLAGPSEVLIIADDGANAEWLALDMLAQAEHDPDARSYLLTPSPEVATQTAAKLAEILKTAQWLPDFIQQSLSRSVIGVCESLESCCAIANDCAPEHLELQVADPEVLLVRLKHYGALFMGYSGCVAFGDYAAGPNHTLPTARRARFQGGLSPMSFLRPQTCMRPTGNIDELAATTEAFASLEGLNAHARSAGLRR